ncbi:biotin transporter BioY [Azospirillum canadense]|uniref:biotin transporter BioY n=1 Tax=Azospirillum canadense TaxID=403962 RepID=UPI002227E0C7|nr:biotin transporter BioY [Azospirillum canadense]MCW2239959.1 biotin transport system substrate-specific component [Azospirillum canadense]
MKPLTTRDLVHCALFAAIVAVLGLVPPIPVGFLPVPITAQLMGVMLAGAVLGARLGGLALVLFLLLVAAGLPLLSGGRGGFGVFLGPTGGFAIGFALAAFVVGWLAERLPRRGSLPSLFVACALGGIGADYALGIPWLSVVSGLPLEKAALGSLTFIPGDLIKAGVAAFAAATVKRAYPLATAH